MKKENCPFCAHRWIRSSMESPVKCPNCKKKYYDVDKLNERDLISEEEDEDK